MTLSSEFFKEQDSNLSLGFADSPAVVTLTTASGDINSSAVMKRVVLTVTIGTETFPFESEFVVGDKVVFDISSAWRAVYNRTGVSILSTGYNALKGKLTCYTEGVVNGTITKNDLGTLLDNVFLLRGGVPKGIVSQKGWTLPGQAYNNFNSNLTLKPNGGVGEVIKKGGKVFISNASKAESGSTGTVTITTTSYGPLNTTGVVSAGGRNVKVVNDPRMAEFMFVNSFGVLEHAYAVVRGSMAVENDSTEFSVVSTPSFAVNEDVAVLGAESRTTWQMSSGYLDRSWLLWWANEFLPRKRSVNKWWMKVGTNWLPVTVTAKSNNTIYDHSKGEMMSVDFEVKSAVEGFVGQIS